MILTTISHPRTFHVDIFLRVRHPRGHFKEGKTSQLDNNLTSMNFSRRNILHAQGDFREDEIMHLLTKMRTLVTAKCETVQWKKTT